MNADTENTIREYFSKPLKGWWVWWILHVVYVPWIIYAIAMGTTISNMCGILLPWGILTFFQIILRYVRKDEIDELIRNLEQKGKYDLLRDNLMQIDLKTWRKYRAFCTEQYVIIRDPVIACTYDEITGFYGYTECDSDPDSSIKDCLKLVTKEESFSFSHGRYEKAISYTANLKEEMGILGIVTEIRRHNPNVEVMHSNDYFRSNELLAAYEAGKPDEMK